MQEMSLYTLNRKINDLQNTIDRPMEKLNVYDFINVESLEDRNNEQSLKNTYITPTEVSLNERSSTNGSAKDYEGVSDVVDIYENKITPSKIYIKNEMYDYGDIYSQGIRISCSGIEGIVEGDEHSKPLITGFSSIESEYFNGNGQGLTNINAKSLNIYEFNSTTNTDNIVGNIIAYRNNSYVELTSSILEKSGHISVYHSNYSDNASTLQGQSLSNIQNYNNLTNKPNSLKNPYSLTIQGNGTTINGTYDGSTSKTINITPDNIGAVQQSYSSTVLDDTNNLERTHTMSIKDGKIDIHDRKSSTEDSSGDYNDLSISSIGIGVSNSMDDIYGERSDTYTNIINSNTINLNYRFYDNEQLADCEYNLLLSSDKVEMKGNEIYSSSSGNNDKSWSTIISSGNITTTGTITAPCFNGKVRGLNMYQYNATTHTDEIVGGIVVYKETDYVKLLSTSADAGDVISVAHASVSDIANKTKNPLIIKINGGHTEGTDMFTFDGTQEQTLNISSIPQINSYNSLSYDPNAIKKCDDAINQGLYYGFSSTENSPNGYNCFSLLNVNMGLGTYNGVDGTRFVQLAFTTVKAINDGQPKLYVRKGSSISKNFGEWKEIAYTDVATTTTNGLMSAADKAKLDGLSTSSGSGSGTDTKNTTGSGNSTSKLFLVGATSQSSTGTQTYSNSNVYTTNGTIYATTFNENGTSLSNKYLGKTATANAANKLATSRKIGNASFDGSADITLANIGIYTASTEPASMTTGTICLVTE